MKRRLLAILLALSMLFTLVPPNIAMAAGENVAKIGATEYATFDEAVEKAVDGDTIELLKSCDTNKGLNLSINLTVKAAEGLTEKPTLNFTKYGIALWNKTLTFENIDVNMKGIVATPYGEWTQYSICTQARHSDEGSPSVINLNNVNMTMDGRNAEGTMVGKDAIFVCEGTQISMKDTVLDIENYNGAALEWNGGKYKYNVTMDNSHYIAKNNYSGIVGTFNIKANKSILDVNNNRGNGSNGSNFYFTDSVVNFNDNGSHGLSASRLSIKNSKVTANHNGLYGVFVNGGMDMDGTSTLTIQENCYKQDADISALCIWSGGGKYSAKIKSGAVVDISNNKASGIETYADTTFEEGVDLNVTNNILSRIKGDVDGHGGGIFSKGRKITLPSDAKIYNNHAISAGDDLYSTGTITFGQTGEDWILDDCDHVIDNWYHDGENARWSAHNSPVNVDPFTETYNENNLATVNDPLALKAAHDLIPLGPDESADWKISKSKSATELTKNAEGKYESDVTLSLPAAEEKLDTDVVFVLDKSTSATLEGQALAMLTELKTKVAKTGAKVKVGVVIFNNEAHVTEFMDLATQYQEIEKAITQNISSGTNTHAGLLAGKKMLDEDTSVPANRKHLIFVSDGISYMFNEKPTAVAWNGIVDNPHLGDDAIWAIWSSPDCWKLQYGDQKYIPESWDTWMASVKTKLDNQGDTYDYPYKGTVVNETPKKAAEYKNYAMSVDKGLYLTKQVYDACQSSGYNCYAMAAETVDNKPSEDNPWGPSFMEYLADGEEVTFDNIKNEILYLLDEGSKVVDVIGAGKDNKGKDYNMDFVPEADKLKLTVGGDKLDTIKVPESELLKNETARFVFRDAIEPKTAQSNNDITYPFVLHYYEKGQDGQSDECFVWDINEPVSNFAPVQLTYAVQLMNPQTTSGTYGEYDQYGKNNKDSLYTNNSAILYPKDSNGDKGVPEAFYKPTVSYTVSGGGGITPSKPGELNPGDPEDLNTVDHYSYIIGYPDGLVRPEGKVTRAEVATIFFRMLTDEARTEGWSQTNNFSDVAAKDWYSNAVSTLSNMGIIAGYEDGTFRPNAPITRAEYAKIAVSFFKETVKDYQGTFSDVAEGQWYTQYVETAAAIGLISGYPDGTFAPNKTITRAEACTITNSTLNRKPCKDHLLPVEEMVNWPDNQPDAWYYYEMQEATNSHDYEWDGETENWTKKLSQRDWVQLEKEWSEANSATGGGEVKNENK